MISTYLSYRLLSADLQKSARLTAALPQVSRHTKYFEDNIVKVKSVDEFLKDTRLFTYAMKAYGLDDMVGSKAFMRKVLQSDLTASDSFANKLSDPRFATFARAFNFTTSGRVAAGATIAQEKDDQHLTERLYSEQRIRRGAAISTDVAYYSTRISSVAHVDDLLADTKLTGFILKTFNINPAHASMSAIKAVLTSDLTAPASTANTMGGAYRELAAAFSFEADGSSTIGVSAQTAEQRNGLIFRFYDKTENRTTPAAAKFRSEQFTTNTATITHVDDLLGDPGSYEFALRAVGLDPLLQRKADIRAVLTSDLTDPGSLANSSSAYLTLRNAFSFNTDGAVDPATGAQTTTQRTFLIDGYMEHYDDGAVRNETSSLEFYRPLLGRVKTTEQFVNTPAVFNFALKAFNIDPATASKAQIINVLQSDPADPTSYVNSLNDKRYRALAAAFNFGADGAVQGNSRAQLDSSLSDVVARHKALAAGSTAAKAQEATDSKYYVATIANIGSVDDLLKDRKLVQFIVKAFGFKDNELKDDVLLRRALTSDPLDKASFANTTSDHRIHELAAAFNFGADGKALKTAGATAQDRDDTIRTVDGYLRNSIESTAGETNTGVRLALYFQRMAPSITSAFGIMGDKALFEVARTALGLPTAMVNLDIDKQAAMITKKLNLADLKDPVKVEKLIARFTALYDQNSSQSNNPILSLFQATTPS